MDVRPATAPDQLPLFDTADLRERFALEELFIPGEVRLIYTHHDRIVAGGVMPGTGTLDLPCPDELRVPYFLARRELAVVNVGKVPSTVTCDGEAFTVGAREVLYIGMGTKKVTFAGDTSLYLFSAAAHATYPTTLVTQAEATPVKLGSIEGSNERTIYKYIHADGAKSCQIVVGLTELGTGSMWNTMPAHVHERRTELYLYFGLPEDARVFHIMGEPEETRHLVLADQQGVISPGWSVHCGFGTASYAFVWAMAGENIDYSDVEPCPCTGMR